jgi:hypothetical protein
MNPTEIANFSFRKTDLALRDVIAALKTGNNDLVFAKPLGTPVDRWNVSTLNLVLASC